MAGIGSFYEFELLEAKQDVFHIDKVIRRDYKKKQALVKWLDKVTTLKENELNALYNKIQKLEEDIATLRHKNLVVKKFETAEMS